MKELLVYFLAKEAIGVGIGASAAVFGAALQTPLGSMGLNENAKTSAILKEDFVESDYTKKIYDEYFLSLFPAFGSGTLIHSRIYKNRRKVPIRYAVKYFQKDHAYRHREIAEIMDKLKAYYLEKPKTTVFSKHSTDEITDHKLFIISLLVTILHDLDELIMPGETHKLVMRAILVKVSQLCAKLKADKELMESRVIADADVKECELDKRLPITLAEMVNDIDKYFEQCAVLDSRTVLRNHLTNISQRLDRIESHLKDFLWMFGMNHDMHYDLTADLRNIEILKTTHSYDEFKCRKSAGDYDGTAVADIIDNPGSYDFFKAFFGIVAVDSKEQAEKLISQVQASASLPIHNEYLPIHQANLALLLMKQSQLRKLRRDLPKVVQTANTFGASAALFAGEEMKGLLQGIATCLGQESEKKGSDDGLSQIIKNVSVSADQLIKHTIRSSAGTPFSKTTVHSAELKEAIAEDMSAIAESQKKIIGSLDINAVNTQLRQGSAELSKLMHEIESDLVLPTKLFDQSDDQKKKSDIKEPEKKSESSIASVETKGSNNVVAVTLTSSINIVLDIYRGLVTKEQITTANRTSLAEYDRNKVETRWFRSSIAHLPIINPVVYFNTTHEKIYKSIILKQLVGLLRDYFLTKKKASFLVPLRADNEKIIDHKLFAIGFLLKMIEDLDQQSADPDTFHQGLNEIYKFCGALAKDETVTQFSVTRKSENFYLCLKNMRTVIADHSIEHHSLKNQTKFQDSVVKALGALNITHYNFQKKLLEICFKYEEIPANILIHDSTRKILVECSNYAQLEENKEYKDSPLRKIVQTDASFKFFKYCIMGFEKPNSISDRSTIVMTFILEQLSLKKEDEKSAEVQAYAASISRLVEDLYIMHDCIKNLEKMHTATDAFGEVTALIAYDKIKAAIEKMQNAVTTLEKHAKNVEKFGLNLMQKIKGADSALGKRIQGVSAFLVDVQGQIRVASQAINEMTNAMDPARVLGQMSDSVDNIASLAGYRSDRQENPKLGYIQLFMASCSQHYKLARAVLERKDIDRASLFNNRKKIVNIIKTEIFSILANKNSEYPMNQLLATWQQLNNIVFTSDQQLLAVFNDELVNPLYLGEADRITLSELSRLTMNEKNTLWTAVQQQRQLSQLIELIELQTRVPQECTGKLNPDYLSVVQNLMTIYVKAQKIPTFGFWSAISRPAGLVNKLTSIKLSYTKNKDQILKSCLTKLIKLLQSDIYASCDWIRMSEIKALIPDHQKYMVTNAERLAAFYTAILNAQEGQLTEVTKPKILAPSTVESVVREMQEVDSDQEQINNYMLQILNQLFAKDYLNLVERTKFINSYRYLKSHPFSDQTKNQLLERFSEKFRAILTDSKAVQKQSAVASTKSTFMPSPSFSSSSLPRSEAKVLGLEELREELKQGQPFHKDAIWYKKHALAIKELGSLVDLKKYALSFWDMLLNDLNNLAQINKLALAPENIRVVAINIHEAFLENKYLREDLFWKIDSIQGSVFLLNNPKATIAYAIHELTGYKQKLEKDLEAVVNVPVVVAS